MSLMLCIATLLLWGRSYWKGVRLVREACDPGRLSISASSIAIENGGARFFSRRMRFQGHLAYDRWAPRNQVSVYFATAPPRQRFRSIWRRLAVTFNSSQVAGDEFPASGGGRAGSANPSDPSASGKYVTNIREATVPLGYLTLPLLLLGVPAVLRVRRHIRAVPPGHCTRCGYDLRASKERCPECGTPIAVRMDA